MNGRNLRTVFGLALVFALLLWLWPRVLPLLAQVRLGVLLLVFALSLVSYPSLVVLRMDFGLRTLFGTKVRFYPLLKLETISKFMYYFSIPKIYIPLKIYLLKKIGGVETATSISYMSIETPVDNLLLLLLSLLGGLTIFSGSSYYGQFLPGLWLLGLLVFGGLALYLLNKRWLLALAHRLVARWQFGKRCLGLAEKILAGVERGFATLFSSPKALLWFGGFTALMWLIQVLKYKALLGGFGVAIGSVPLVFALALASLIGILSMIPGGLGTREAAGTVAFVVLGVPSEIALLVLLVDRIISQGIVLALGLLMLVHHDFDYKGMISAVKYKSAK